MSDPMVGAEPISTISDDPFPITFLRDPYPHYERMRETGSVVWLSQHTCYAVTRYDEVQEVLRDWKTFSSAPGVGLANFKKGKPWRPLSPVLEADPPLHTRTRAVLSTGVSMIVALMAAHRAASGSKGAPTVYCQEEIERIQAYLHNVGTEQAAGTASRRRPQTNADSDETGHLIPRGENGTSYPSRRSSNEALPFRL
jgi:hypothetical protein